MNTATLWELHEALHSLLKNGPVCDWEGVCDNVCDIVDIHPGRLEPLFEGWPHHSVDRKFPVPGGWQTYCQAKDEGTLWTGEQGELRQDLMAHVLNRVNALLLASAACGPTDEVNHEQA